MKKIYFVIFLWIFVACERDNIDVYHDDDYIQFSKYMIDSSVCSFLAYPTEMEVGFPIGVEIIGSPSQTDREYKIEVMKNYSTTTTADYVLPTSFKVKAGCVVDTCWIKFKRTEEISQVAKRLVLQLVETSDFKLGQVDCRINIVYVSNVIAKPDWWTSTVTDSYLGDYSDKKYRLFIEQTGKVDLDPNDANELRYYSLIFKNYLLQEKDAGRMVMEEDGTEMTVELIAG